MCCTGVKFTHLKDFSIFNFKIVLTSLCGVAKAGENEREMGEAPAAETLDLDTIRTRVNELIHIHGNHSHISDSNPLDSQNLLQEFAQHLQVTPTIHSYTIFFSLFITCLFDKF